MTASQELAQSPSALKPNTLAFISLFIALIAVSFAAIFIRFSEADIGFNATVFNRFFIFFSVFGTGRAIAILRSPREEATLSEPLTRRHWILLLLMGVIATFSLVLWALSLTQTSVANSVLLNNLTPLFASFGGWLFFRQRFDRQFIIGTIIALIGAIAVGMEDFHLEDSSLIGDGWALLSAVFLAAYFLIVEQLRDRFDATSLLLCRCAIGTTLLLPLMLLTKEPLFPSTPSGWFAVICLGLICEGMGQRLLAASLERFSASFVCLFLLLEPLCSALLAWVIFGESLNFRDAIAFAVVLSGIYIAKSSESAAQSSVAQDALN